MNGDSALDRKAAPLSPTLRELVAVLFRQRALIEASFVIVFVAVMLYGAAFPSYRAEMKVLVRRGRLDPPMAPQPTALSEFSRYDITEEELNSEVQLLQDQDVLRQVVLATKLDERERSFMHVGNQTGDALVMRAVHRLANRIQVAPIRKTLLINVAYESGDPALSARILKALATVYTQKHLTAHRPPGEFGFFQLQTNSYRKELENAENQLLDLTHKQVVSPALERDLALQKLSDADSTYRQIAVAISETAKRVTALETQLSSLPERKTTEMRSSDNPELQQQLKSTLLNLELKKAELLTKFQPSYRLVQEVDQQISETKAAISAEALAPLRQETTNTDPRYEWATSELEKAKVDLAALRARQAEAGLLVASYKNLATRLGEEAIAHQDLLRTAKAAEENYLLYLRKREEARIGDALDQRGILNVAIVQEPAVPVLPKWSLKMVMAVALASAAIFSAGIAFAADYLAPGYRTPEEVTLSLGIPVLASLPHRAA
jgi:uncharacterized protein involved in exopolysaccharide biosynthesis